MPYIAYDNSEATMKLLSAFLNVCLPDDPDSFTRKGTSAIVT